MKVRGFALCVLLVFMGCGDDPLAPPTGPTAAFVVTPESGWAGLMFEVDASPSSDPNDADSTLSVRWDWENDGVWDTAWSKEKRATHAYATVGVKTIRLEVQDPSQQRGQGTRSVNATLLASPAVLIDALEEAYRLQAAPLFASLLANDPDPNAQYVFLLSAPTDIGETQWGYQEEVRIHRRMFEPSNPPPGDLPVPPELWLQSLAITLTQQEPFSERTDLYTKNDGPLNDSIWRATDARYATYVYFDLFGTDYKVEGEANFVVIEDLRKSEGEAGKFLLYIWEDVASPPATLEAPASWSALKALFR